MIGVFRIFRVTVYKIANTTLLEKTSPYSWGKKKVLDSPYIQCFLLFSVSAAILLVTSFCFGATLLSAAIE